ncbi:MAG: MotA/TolQ/ExbB proton channel family protein [Candidatus Latescibacterota bacterium]|jgi:biopolymer transport protein ExbB
MRELLRQKSYFVLMGAFVLLIAFAAFAGAQEEQTAQGTEQTTEQTDTTAGQTPAEGMSSATGAMTVQFLDAPNDSAEVAAGIQELIRKERSGFINRVKRSGLGQNYIKGGFFMHFLLACSLIALVFIIERGWTLSRAKINTKALMMKVVRALREEGVDAALQVCQRTRGPIAAILHAGLLRASRGPSAVEKAIETSGAIEMSFLERGLVALATIANVAPLLGFLGTVSGMISAFAAIAAAEQVSAKLVAKGIQEALITTATGLIIAVPVTIAHSFFVSQIDRFIIEMEEASAELVDELLELEHQKGAAA